MATPNTKPTYVINFDSRYGTFEVHQEQDGTTERHVLDGGNGFPPDTIKHAVFHARREGFEDIQFWQKDGGSFQRVPIT